MAPPTSTVTSCPLPSVDDEDDDEDKEDEDEEDEDEDEEDGAGKATGRRAHATAPYYGPLARPCARGRYTRHAHAPSLHLGRWTALTCARRGASSSTPASAGGR